MSMKRAPMTIQSKIEEELKGTDYIVIRYDAEEGITYGCYYHQESGGIEGLELFELFKDLSYDYYYKGAIDGKAKEYERADYLIERAEVIESD